MKCLQCHEKIYKSRLNEYQAIFADSHHLNGLRTTNDPCNDEVEYVHKTLLPAIGTDMVTLEKRITELQSAVELLSQEKDNLIRITDSFQTLISARRRLPTELLMEIFQYACEADWTAWQQYASYPGTTPFILSRVCRRWRQVALSCPAMWSRIRDCPEEGSSQAAGHALDLALARSENFPLCIEMYPEKTFFEHIQAYSSRWSEVTLSMITPDLADVVFNELRGAHPLLKRLEIFAENATQIPQTGFSQYPSLQTVCLRDYRILTMDLPWVQITTLFISDSFPITAHDLLMYIRALIQCPSLRTLNIKPPGRPLDPLQDKSSIVTLPDLKCLDTSFGLVLDHLNLPQLEIACFAEYPGQLQDFIAAFSRLVSRSQCDLRLKYLCLIKIPITKDLVPILLLTRNLVELDIRAEVEERTCRSILMSLVDKLQVNPGEDVSDSFLPKLQFFSISLSQHVDRRYFPYLQNQPSLVRALQSRWNVDDCPGLERLKAFRYWITADWLAITGGSESPLELTADTEAALQLLVDDGMKISIRVHSVFLKPEALRVDFGHYY